jgi:hypothetical protein
MMMVVRVRSHAARESAYVHSSCYILELPEGTLGRIAVSSVRKPRSLIALTSDAPEDAEEAANSLDSQDGAAARSFMFASRSIDFVIEEGLRCLMDIEDVENLLYANTTSPEE